MAVDTIQRTDLGTRLIAAGLINEAQLELAVREQRRRGHPLNKVLVDLGLVSAIQVSKFFGGQAHSLVVDLSKAVVDSQAVQLVPKEMARRHKVFPLSIEDGVLTMAISNPFDVVAIDAVRQVTGLQVKVVTATERDILNQLDRFEGPGSTIQESIDEMIVEKDEEARRYQVKDIEVSDGDDLAGNDAPTIRLVSQIIGRAIEKGASDIHFEPEERMMRIRVRIDGVLHPDVLIPKTLQSLVVARMKILSDLDVSENRVPQDGRASISVGRRQVSLRVSSLPTAHGENIVARILSTESGLVNLSALGMSEENESKLRWAIDQPYGVVIVTGPTGSGKTTTLYSVLNEVSSTDWSIFTLEDPIEYRMAGIRQTQIKEDVGLTFSAGLRALLRQDPDIILVGETRDTETAQLMVRAALTGHMVFSTLHTNDAPGAIPRLLDMGVEPYLLPDSLVAVLAQRLVRRLCPQCRELVPDPRKVMEELKIPVESEAPLQLWKNGACPACGQAGYRGRQGIFELMVLDHRFHDPIVHRAGAPEFARLAKEAGMRNMFDDGVRLSLKGATTLQELLRVTRVGG